jgi:hypothetical protein
MRRDKPRQASEQPNRLCNRYRHAYVAYAAQTDLTFPKKRLASKIPEILMPNSCLSHALELYNANGVRDFGMRDVAPYFPVFTWQWPIGFRVLACRSRFLQI